MVELFKAGVGVIGADASVLKVDELASYMLVATVYVSSDSKVIAVLCTPRLSVAITVLVSSN